MTILFSFVIFFVILITNKFFLFNEEFLILLSFLGFCFVIYENLNVSFKNYFIDKTNIIKNSFFISIRNIRLQLIKKRNLNNKMIILNNNFNILKNHYLVFAINFLNNFLIFLKVKENNNLLIKIKEINFIENSYSKFITLLLFKKVLEITTLIKFYETFLKLNRFQTFRLINIISLIKKI